MKREHVSRSSVVGTLLLLVASATTANAQAPSSRPPASMSGTRLGEVFRIPPAPPTQSGVTIKTAYDRFRDTTTVVVEGKVGSAQRKRGGLAGLLDKVAPLDDGLVTVRMLTAGAAAPFDPPAQVEVWYAAAEQPVERAAIPTTVGRGMSEWLIDNKAPAVRVASETVVVDDSHGDTPTAMVRQAYRTVMPVALFLDLANAKAVAVRFGGREFAFDAPSLNALALAASQLRSVRVRPQPATVTAAAQDSYTAAPMGGVAPAAPQAPTRATAVIARPNQRTAAARAMLAQIEGVWADVETLGGNTYFRFEEGGYVTHFPPSKSQPPLAARYVVDPARRLILLYANDQAPAPFLELALTAASPTQIILTALRMDDGEHYDLNEPVALRRMALADATEIEQRRARAHVQYRSFQNW